MLETGSYYLLITPYAGVSKGLYRLRYEGNSFLLLQKSPYHAVMVDREIIPFLMLLIPQPQEESNRRSQSLHMMYH